MSTPNPLTWARDHAPVLADLTDEFREERPFEGLTVAICSHLEASTGVFVETIHAGGAECLVAPSEPKSTHADVIDHLDSREGIRTFAEPDMSDRAFERAQSDLLAERPDLIADDACELIARAHASHPDAVEEAIGGVEQTTAGVRRLEAIDADAGLGFPAYGVNDTPMKRCFDNVHGTGESSLVNVAQITNTALSGKTVVVGGYGHCGRGIARKARGLGARTVVTEVDPRKALEAHMDGHLALSMAEAAEIGDLFVPSTGSRDVIRRAHFERMRDGAQLANAGHFDVEIAVDDLEAMAERTTEPIAGVTRYHLPDGRRLDLLTEGRLVNLTGPNSKGHPIEVMDTTFAMMAVALRELAVGERPEPGVHAVPDRLDREVADRKLAAVGGSRDDLTAKQEAYLSDWALDGEAF